MTLRRVWQRLLSVGLAAAVIGLRPAGSALAHGGESDHVLSPSGLSAAWQWDATVWIGLAILVAWYGWGVYRVWSRAGIDHGVSIRQALAFSGAIGLLVIALVSPLDALADSLFAAHMVQHMLLIFGAAPLFVFSDPGVALTWGLPRTLAQRLARWWNRQPLGLFGLWRGVRRPMVSWALFAGIWTIWHFPALYELALDSRTAHSVEHLTFLGAALLLWWSVARPAQQKRVAYALSSAAMFAALVQGSALGALLTFSIQPLYNSYLQTTAIWGLTPLQDQQFGGLIMWVPSGFIFTLLTIAFLGLWLNHLEHPAAARRRLPALADKQGAQTQRQQV